MVVVDTSVWVDLLRGRPTPEADRLAAMLRAGAPVVLTDVVFMELLAGGRTPRDAARLERRLRSFPILRLDSLEHFSLAAEMARASRRAGVAIRSRLDYLIAAVCVTADAPILHADADFDRLASCTALRVFGSA